MIFNIWHSFIFQGRACWSEFMNWIVHVHLSDDVTTFTCFGVNSDNYVIFPLKFTFWLNGINESQCKELRTTCFGVNSDNYVIFPLKFTFWLNGINESQCKELRTFCRV